MNGNIKYNKPGYTLLEILVVIALLAIILSIGIPSIKVIGNFEEKNEINNLKRDILQARNNAILEGSIYTLQINQEKNYYSIGNKNKVIKRKDLTYWTILPGNTFNSRIKFLPTGSPDKGGTFSVRNRKNKTIELRILPVTGKINTYEIKQ